MYKVNLFQNVFACSVLPSVNSAIISQRLCAIAEILVRTVSGKVDLRIALVRVKTCPFRNYAAMAEFPNGLKLYPLLGWGLETG